MKLLDSNILIYATEPGQETLRERILAEPAGVSVVTMVEVLGYHLLTREEESDLRALLNELSIFPTDIVVAERAVALRQQRKMGLGDALIAATALVHQCPLVTRNVDDFKHVAGLEIINPFAEPETA
ncbi:MAG: type II toxin-antitoxin system VapC family toxin [Chthoniobacteraceae bacterium]